MMRRGLDGWFGMVGIVVMMAMCAGVPFAVIFRQGNVNHNDDLTTIAVAEFIVLLCLSILVLQRGIQRRLRRYAAGECIYCGYNLSATPDRCPECGRDVITGKVA
jgi:O-antigen/teichoic acid export membrane protein